MNYIAAYLAFVAYAGMLCDLDKTVDRTCILQSPWTPDAFSWTCMLINYQLSDYDMKLTLDLLVGGMSNATYTLLANESALWISNPDLNSPIAIKFTASRYLVSTEDYEYALVSSVAFLSCAAPAGKCEYKIYVDLLICRKILKKIL